MMSEPYTVLGVSQDASAEQIKAAYRALARKCHPDHFPEGPERAAAEEKMIELNRAYEAAMRRSASGEMRRPSHAGRGAQADVDERLSDVRSLMALGQLDNARRTLMQVDGRGAEWNYLYGMILMRMRDYAKAAVYFGIAARMNPESGKYRAARRSAETLRDGVRKNPFQQMLSGISRLFRG